MEAALYRRDFLTHTDRYRYLIEPVSIPRLRDARGRDKQGPYHENSSPDLERGYRERCFWTRDGEEAQRERLKQFTPRRFRFHVQTGETYAHKNWFCVRFEETVPFICCELDRHRYGEMSDAEILQHEAWLDEQREAINQSAASLGTRPVWTHSPGDQVRRPFTNEVAHVRGEYAWIRLAAPLPRKKAEALVRWMKYEFQIEVECPVIEGYVRLPGQAWCEPIGSKAGASSRDALADFLDRWSNATPADENAIEAALEAAPEFLAQKQAFGFSGTTYGYDLATAPDSFDVLKTICSRTVQRYQYDQERLGEMMGEAKNIFMAHRPGSSISGAELDRKATYILSHFLAMGPNGHYQPFSFDQDTVLFLSRVRGFTQEEIDALETFIRMQNNPNLKFLYHKLIYRILGKRRYLRMRKKGADLFEIVEKERHYSILNAINGETQKGHCRRYGEVRRILTQKVRAWAELMKKGVQGTLRALREKWSKLWNVPAPSSPITTIGTPPTAQSRELTCFIAREARPTLERQRPPPRRKPSLPRWPLEDLCLDAEVPETVRT